MNLMTLIKTEMVKAWLSIVDLLTPAEYIKITRSSFNPATGTVSQGCSVLQFKRLGSRKASPDGG